MHLTTIKNIKKTSFTTKKNNIAINPGFLILLWETYPINGDEMII